MLQSYITNTLMFRKITDILHTLMTGNWGGGEIRKNRKNAIGHNMLAALSNDTLLANCI